MKLYNNLIRYFWDQHSIKLVLGILPPGKFPPERYTPVYSPAKECSPPKKNWMFFWSVAALFRFVAHFTRVRIEDSSGNRFASTAYFGKSGFVTGETTGVEPFGGGGGNFPVTMKWNHNTIKYFWDKHSTYSIIYKHSKHTYSGTNIVKHFTTISWNIRTTNILWNHDYHTIKLFTNMV